MFESFLTGLARASRQRKLIALLLVTNILFAAPLTLPIFLLILQTAGGTRAARTLFADKLDFLWLADFINGQFDGFSIISTGALLALLLVVLGAVYLLVNMLFAGGILNVLADEDGRFTMQRFWAGCGAYFARFFRLWCTSLFFYAAVLVIYKLLMIPVNAADRRASAAQPGILKRWAVIVLFLLLLAVVNMIFDYAKIGAVVGDRRRMLRETARAVRFTLRRFAPALSLYLLIAVVGLAVFSLFTWLRSLIPQSSYVALFAAVLLGQLALASRLWTRVAFYAAELDYYRRHAVEEITPEAPSEASPAEETVPVAAAESAPVVSLLLAQSAPPIDEIASQPHDAPAVLYDLSGIEKARAELPEEETAEKDSSR